MKLRAWLIPLLLSGLTLGVVLRSASTPADSRAEDLCVVGLRSARSCEWHAAAGILALVGTEHSAPGLLRLIREDVQTREPRFWRAGTAMFLGGDVGPLPVSVRAGYALWRLGERAREAARSAYAGESGETLESLRIRQVLRAVLNAEEQLFTTLATNGLPRQALELDLALAPEAQGA